MKILKHISDSPMQNRGNLLTEKSNNRSNKLDLLNTTDLVQLFSNEDLEPQKAVEAAIPQIIEAIESIFSKLKDGGRLFYLGAGTSGRLGVLDASECPPTFCTPPELVQGIIAGGYKALTTSSEGLEDQGVLAINDLEQRGFNSKDCLLGITAGGTTQYVLEGLSYANKIGALSISLSCVSTNEVSLPSNVDIRILTGPELLTGSTRLKAGTATKMVLNMISTIIMIKLGKVYGNKMIDLSVSNNKLLDRGLRILREVGNVDSTYGKELLRITNGSVKLALLMSLANLDLQQAQDLLDKNQQQLRKSLEKAEIELK